MSSYGIVLWETDLGRDRIIRDFRRNPLKVDKKYMEDNKLCSCPNQAFPVIRQLEFYEFDVLDSCDDDFKKRMKLHGIEFKKRNILSKIATFFFNLPRTKKNGRIEIFSEPFPSHGRLNHRSRVYMKKADEEYKKSKNFKKCVRCNGNIPVDWL